MDRPEHLPKDLDKDNLAWLRLSGYSLNNKDNERYLKVKEFMKKWYTYEYYFYVDIDIKQEAIKEADLLKKEDFMENPKKFYKTWDNILREEKIRLIKELYGLEKKGIR